MVFPACGPSITHQKAPGSAATAEIGPGSGASAPARARRCPWVGGAGGNGHERVASAAGPAHAREDLLAPTASVRAFGKKTRRLGEFAQRHVASSQTARRHG